MSASRNCIEDPRAPDRIQHGLAEMIRFRALLITALTCGAACPDRPPFLNPNPTNRAPGATVTRGPSRPAPALRAILMNDPG